MMSSIRPKQYPKFSERWLMVVLAETLRSFSSAVVWLVTLPSVALAMACVVAWDAMHGLSAAGASPLRLSVIGGYWGTRLRRGFGVAG